MPLENLSPGAFGSEVAGIQDRLRQHGFDLPESEISREFYGPATRDAVTELQRKFGLKATGTVDVNTRVVLQGAVVGAPSKPTPPPVSNGSKSNGSGSNGAVATNGATRAAVTPVARASNSSMQSMSAILNTSPVSAPSAPVVSSSGDYSGRDNNAKVTFYVLLWKRKGLDLVSFDDYWRDVHGPVCARLPGQFQYWQFHVAHNDGGIFPAVDGVSYKTTDDDQFDGIAELTFRSVADRDIWFKASSILMDDEHNIFSKAIGYVTELGNSKTYTDGITTGDPNGDLGVIKYHVMVRQQPRVSNADFRKYMKDTFAANITRHKSVLKFRLHLFEPPDLSRPDAAGVAHFEPPNKQYQAAFEIAFRNQLERETFFASPEYARAVADQAKFVKQVTPLPERDSYTFVYDGKMTLAGERGSRTAQLITELGATNQLRDDIRELVVGGVSSGTPLPAVASSNNGIVQGSGAQGYKPTMAQIYSPFNRD